MKKYIGLLLAASVLSGCTALSPPPLDKKNMVPSSSGMTLKATGKSVALGAFEGQRGKGRSPYVITVYDLKNILTQGMESSRLFSSVRLDPDANTDYVLSAKIIKQSGSGPFAVKYEFIVAYELKRNGTDEVVFSKTITGMHSVSVGEELVGATRYRLAVEGAARDNIKQFLESISALQL